MDERSMPRENGGGRRRGTTGCQIRSIEQGAEQETLRDGGERVADEKDDEHAEAGELSDLPELKIKRDRSSA